MKRLEEKRQFLVGIVLLGVTGIFYVQMLLIPLIGRFKRIAAEATRYRRELAVTEAGLKRMEEVKKEIEILEGSVGEMRRHFPGERELPVLLEELSGIAENAGVKILEITPGKGEPMGSQGGTDIKGLRQLPITMTALSGYHEFGKFVNALENSERVYVIETLTVTSNPENERVHSVRLILKAFLQEEPQAR